MWGLTNRIVTVLYAASSPLESYSPESTKQIAKDFQQFYNDLGDKVAVYKDVTPTIKFSFVTPPGHKEGKNWYDDDVVFSDAQIMDLDDSGKNIFEKVSDKHATNGDGTMKPIALYLPGLDGFGLSSAGWQFNDLSNTFELWRMSVSTTDRSKFGDLLKVASEFVDELALETDRPIYLIAESMSGLLAPAVALKFQNREKRGGRKNPLKGLVLVNPATSFDESNWDVLAPLLTTFGRITSSSTTNKNDNIQLPSPYAVLGGLTLASLIPSSQQFDRIVEKLLPIPQGRTLAEIGSYIEGFLDMMNFISEKIPHELLEHRLNKWLIVGNSLVNPRLSQLDVPTLLIAGKKDNLLHSDREVSRLGKILPNCEKLVVDGGGHFVLDENVNLTEAIIYSKILDPLGYETTKKYDPILDWKLPNRETIKEMFETTVKGQIESYSPIYISTDSNGKRSMGLKNLPKSEGPILFVSNHQLLGSDLNLVVGKLLEQDIVVRGLGHPIIFTGEGRAELQGRIPGLTPSRRKERNGGVGELFDSANLYTNFLKFGVVMVTPRNYYRLLQAGQNVLLFPGGIMEAFHSEEDANKVLWPEKVDFIRTAAKFNATIVPLSSVGMAESYTKIVESQDVENIPIVGDFFKEFSGNVTAARFDVKDDDEIMIPPIIAPGIPSRNYFLFGKPLSTEELDPKDKGACEKFYNEIRDTVQGGLDELVDARKKDPFNDAPQRFAYERLTGNKAPTFDIEVLREKP